ncbi:uncharacterized protein LOC131945169 [Physella acuta]|uniref:uncharacterized protein LOC131945169 n=1 Tax=Physella acuta TaxID=109671 RepID=UPI0027DB8F9C|nr:uncharacterized protein LOC131945169 [Physella acuta]
MCKSYYLFIATAVFILLFHLGSVQTIRCEKRFFIGKVLISCTNHSEFSYSKFSLSYTKIKDLIVPEVDCQSNGSLLICNQYIPLMRLGMGNYSIFAIIQPMITNSSSFKIMESATEIPISLAFPKVAFDNCSYFQDKIFFIAHCTCRRIDLSEISTLIILHTDDNRTVFKESGSSLFVEFHINKTTEIKCQAVNSAGWKSEIIRFGYILDDDDSTIDTTAIPWYTHALIAVFTFSLLSLFYKKINGNCLFSY